MKKSLGAANAKVIGIVVAVIAVLGLVYAFSQGGGGTSGSNDGVLKTLDIIGNEFTNTMDDFMPDLGLKQFNEKVQKDGVYSADLKLSGDVQPVGNIKLGIDIKSDPNAKKMQMQFDVGAIGAALNMTITAINNEMFLNIPTMYEKPIKVNFDTLGKDIQSDTFKKMSGNADNSSVEKYKDLKVNLFSDYSNPSKFKAEFEKHISPELTALEKNAKVEKVEVEKAFADKLKEEGSTRENLEQVNIEVDSKDFKALLLKVVDFYEVVQKSQISGLQDEDYQNSFKKAKEEIEKYKMPEKINFKLVSSKGIPVIISIQGENKETVNFLFAGNKNLTDKIVIYPSGDNAPNEKINFEMKTGDKENTLVLDFVNTTELSTSYKKDSKELSMNLRDGASEIFNLKGKYTDVKKGESYKFDIESLEIHSDSDTELKFSGSAGASASKPDIKAVGDSIEVLKLDETELMKFALDVNKNLQNNYGGLMTMMNSMR